MTHHLLLHCRWVRGEGDTSAATEAGEVQCQQSPTSVEVVQVLVELEETCTEPVDHNERVSPCNWLCRLGYICSDDRLLVNGDVEIGVRRLDHWWGERRLSLGEGEEGANV